MPIAAVIQLLQIILPVVVQEAPHMITAIKDLLSKENPTADDWASLSQYVKDYDSFGIKPPSA